jgi:hypothetical protein
MATTTQAAATMLSLDEIRQIAEHLCQQGVTPSGNAIVQYCHANRKRISKRTALKHLQALAAQGVTFTPAAPVLVGMTTTLDPMHYHTVSPEDTQDLPAPAAPAPAAPAVDPVAVCEQAVKAAERHFLDARDALMQAKLYLLATQQMPVQGILHGSLHQGDEIHQEALADVDEHKRLYDAAWQRREQARYARAQAKKAHLEADRHAWVAHYRPKVVASLAATQARVDRTDLSRWERADAVQQYGFARLAYNEAMNEALAALNGVTP